jgi:hypothetical protein
MRLTQQLASTSNLRHPLLLLLPLLWLQHWLL